MADNPFAKYVDKATAASAPAPDSTAPAPNPFAKYAEPAPPQRNAYGLIAPEAPTSTPTEPQQPEQPGMLTELGHAVERGALDIPRMAGETAQYLGHVVGSPGLESAGTKVVQGVDQFMKDHPSLQASPEAQNGGPWSLHSAVSQGGEMVTSAMGPALAGAAAGSFIPGIGTATGFLAGSILSLPLFFGSQAQSTYNKVRAAAKSRGLSDKAADDLAVKKGAEAGAIMAGGALAMEVTTGGIGRLVPVKLLPDALVKLLPGKAKADIAKASVKALRTPMDYLKTLAKDFTVQGTVIGGQTAGIQAVEASAGAGKEPSLGDLKSLILPTAVMSLLTAGGAETVGAMKRARASSLLADANAKPQARIRAAQAVAGEISVHDKDVAKAFLRDAASRIAQKKPVIMLTDEEYRANQAQAGTDQGAAQPTAGDVEAEAVKIDPENPAQAAQNKQPVPEADIIDSGDAPGQESDAAYSGQDLLADTGTKVPKTKAEEPSPESELDRLLASAEGQQEGHLRGRLHALDAKIGQADAASAPGAQGELPKLAAERYTTRSALADLGRKPITADSPDGAAQARDLRMAVGMVRPGERQSDWLLPEGQYRGEQSPSGRVLMELAEQARETGPETADAAEHTLERGALQQLPDAAVAAQLSVLIRKARGEEIPNGEAQPQQQQPESAQVVPEPASAELAGGVGESAAAGSEPTAAAEPEQHGPEGGPAETVAAPGASAARTESAPTPQDEQQAAIDAVDGAMGASLSHDSGAELTTPDNPESTAGTPESAPETTGRGTEAAAPETNADAGETKPSETETAPPRTETAPEATAPETVQTPIEKPDRRRTKAAPFRKERRTGPDRRKDAAQRKRVDEMSGDELRQELLTDPVSGLPNRRAYAEAEKLPLQASVDVDGLKWVNDNLSHADGDQLLKVVGRALRDEFGDQAFHLSGDEFAVQAEPKQGLGERLRKVRNRLADAEITAKGPDGETVTLKGVGFSFGLGRSLKEADHALQRDKAERAKKGERSARGEPPRGVTRRAAERKQNQEHQAAEKALGDAPKLARVRPSEEGDHVIAEWDPHGDVAALAGRERGPIVLTEGEHFEEKGKNRYGVVHVEHGHRKPIADTGYQNVRDFVDHVLSTATAIRRSESASIFVVGKQHGKASDVVLLQPVDRNGRTEWMVETAGRWRNGRINKMRPLWEASRKGAVFPRLQMETPYAISGRDTGENSSAGSHDAQALPEGRRAKIDRKQGGSQEDAVVPRPRRLPPDAISGNEPLRSEESSQVGGDAQEKGKPSQSQKTESEKLSRQEQAPDTKVVRTVKQSPISRVANDVGELTAGWATTPDVRTVVSFQDFPERIRLEAERQEEGGANGTPNAAYDPQTGAIWLAADQLPSRDAVERALLHEGLHKGLREVFGKDIVPLLDQIYMGNTDSIAAFAKRYGADLRTNNGKRLATEEFLASLAESGERPKLLRRVLSKIRQLLRRMGFKVEFSDGELRDLVARIGQRNRGEIHVGRSFEGDAAGATALMARRAPTFYSQLQRTVEAKGPGSASAEQWDKTLQAWVKKGQIKPEELEWSGSQEWLREQPGRRVSREQLAQYLRDNEIQAEEIQKGAQPEVEWEKTRDVWIPVDRKIGAKIGKITELPNGKFLHEAPGGIRQTFDTLAEAQRSASNRELGDASYMQYQLPGGENYRELLLTLPPKDQGYDSEYRSGHFDEPNVLAHVRFNERTDVMGRKTLFVEEVQSDWHQEGRDRGYRSGELKRIEQQARAEAKNPLPADTGGWSVNLLRAAGVSEDTYTRWDKALMQHIQQVPEAPFKTTWPMLIMKRMIRYAADHGFEQIAWTTGEHQIARYDLRKQLDSLGYQRNEDGTYKVSAQLREERRGKLLGEHIAPDDLARYVGKDIAARIRNEDGQLENWAGNNEPRGEWRVLHGDDLAVGGEGMKAFYDRILPNELNRYIKKFGARVGDAEIPTEPTPYDITGEGGEEPTTRVHAVEVTPAMREAAIQGQPMFQRREPTGDEHLDALLGKIGAPRATLWQRIKAWLTGHTIDEFTQAHLDKFYGLRRALDHAGYDAMSDQGAYILTRMSTSTESQTFVAMVKGALSWDGDRATFIKGSKGLVELLEPIADKLDLWEAAMVARRAKRLMAEGREHALTPEMIAAGMKLWDEHPEFKKVADDWAEYNKHTLDFAEKAGVIDPAQRALWENADYIPFYRVMDEASDAGPKGPKGRGGLSHQASGIRKLTGGQSNINDPLANMIMNTAHLVDASMKNHAMRRAIEQLEGTDLIDKAPYDFRPELIPKSQIRKILEANGVDSRQISPEVFKGMEQMLAMKAPTDKNVVRVLIDGKPKYYEVHDELLLRSLTNINQADLGAFMKLFRGPKRLLTTMVTADPAFQVANFLRDTLSAFVLGRDNVIPIVSAIKGAKQALMKDDTYWEMLAAGGGFHSGYLNATDPNASARIIRAELHRKGFGNTLIDTPVRAWEAWKEFGSAMENANRLAVYDGAIKAGKSKLAAAFEAKDLMDFSMRGDGQIYQFLAGSVPFLNARIQGIYRLGRGARENPGGFAARGMLITMASLALWYINKNDDRWQKLEDWDKDTYWHFWLSDKPDAPHFRIPKPFEVGVVFGTIPERLMGALYSNSPHPWQKFMDRLGWNIWQVFNVGQLPQAVGPIAEQIANRSFFTGRPIVGLGLQNLEPEAQFNPWTHTTSIEIGRELGLSPVRIDAFLQGYFGTLGGYALSAADVVTRALGGYPARPALRADQVPVLGRFMRDAPPQGTQFATDFYDLLSQLQATANTIRKYRKLGEPKQARRVFRDAGPDLRFLRPLQHVNSEIQQINDEIRQVTLSRDIGAEQKRRLIDRLTERKNTLYERAMKGVQRRQKARAAAGG